MPHPLPDQLQAAIARSNAARQEHMDQEAAFRQTQRKARKDGLCDAEVQALPSRPTSRRKTYWRDLETAEAKARGEDVKENEVQRHRVGEVDKRSSRRFRTICCKPIHPGKGKCREHYLREVLHVSSMGDARGKRFRPFKDWQVPLGDMSETQQDLLADTKRLPLKTAYEDCIATMNAVDPSHALQPIYEPPRKAPRRSRSSRAT